MRQFKDLALSTSNHKNNQRCAVVVHFLSMDVLAVQVVMILSLQLLVARLDVL